MYSTRPTAVKGKPRNPGRAGRGRPRQRAPGRTGTRTATPRRRGSSQPRRCGAQLVLTLDGGGIFAAITKGGISSAPTRTAFALPSARRQRCALCLPGPHTLPQPGRQLPRLSRRPRLIRLHPGGLPPPGVMFQALSPPAWPSPPSTAGAVAAPDCIRWFPGRRTCFAVSGTLRVSSSSIRYAGFPGPTGPVSPAGTPSLLRYSFSTYFSTSFPSFL